MIPQLTMCSVEHHFSHRTVFFCIHGAKHFFPKKSEATLAEATSAEFFKLKRAPFDAQTNRFCHSQFSALNKAANVK